MNGPEQAERMRPGTPVLLAWTDPDDGLRNHHATVVPTYEGSWFVGLFAPGYARAYPYLNHFSDDAAHAAQRIWLSGPEEMEARP